MKKTFVLRKQNSPFFKLILLIFFCSVFKNVVAQDAGIISTVSISENAAGAADPTMFITESAEFCDATILGASVEGPDFQFDIQIPADQSLACSDATLTVCRRGDYGGTGETVTIVNGAGQSLAVIPGQGEDCDPFEVCTTVTISADDLNQDACDGVITFILETPGGTPGTQGSEVDAVCPDPGNCVRISGLSWAVEPRPPVVVGNDQDLGCLAAPVTQSIPITTLFSDLMVDESGMPADFTPVGNSQVTVTVDNGGVVNGNNIDFTAPGCYEVNWNIFLTCPGLPISCYTAPSATAYVLIGEEPVPSFTYPTTACIDEVVNPTITSPTYDGTVDRNWVLVSGPGTIDVATGAVTVTGCGDIIVELEETIEYAMCGTIAAGNCMATSSQITIGNDEVDPVIDCPILPTVVFQCVEDVPAAPTANVTDNCDADTTVDAVVADNGGAGCENDPLIITYTYDFTDACGNAAATCEVSVTVVDDQGPIITCPPDDLTVYNTEADIPPGVTDLTAFVGLGGAIMDNCSAVTVAFADTVEPGCPNATNQATVIRTYTITDACGNPSTCTQTFLYSCCLAAAGALAPIDDICIGASVTGVVDGAEAPAPDYGYDYVLTDAAGTIVDGPNTTGIFTPASPGDYCIYGVSYQVVTGAPDYTSGDVNTVTQPADCIEIISTCFTVFDFPTVDITGCGMPIDSFIVEGNYPDGSLADLPEVFVYCEGELGCVDALAIGGSGTFSYEWNQLDDNCVFPEPSIGTGANLADLETGTYEVIATDDVSGCVVKDTVKIFIDVPPMINLNNGGDTMIYVCEGSSFDIPANALPGPDYCKEFCDGALPQCFIDASSIITVCMEFDHTFISDLSFDLVAPDGTIIPLVLGDCCPNSSDDGSQFCFTNDPNVGVPLDWDVTGSGVTDLLGLGVGISGTWQPQGGVGVFNPVIGIDANAGPWAMIVTDIVGGDSGTFNNFDVTITSAGAGCNTLFESPDFNAPIPDNNEAFTYETPVLECFNIENIISEYEWVCSDGTTTGIVAVTNDEIPDFPFTPAAPGDYVCTLTVWDLWGCSSSSEFLISVPDVVISDAVTSCIYGEIIANAAGGYAGANGLDFTFTIEPDPNGLGAIDDPASATFTSLPCGMYDVVINDNTPTAAAGPNFSTGTLAADNVVGGTTTCFTVPVSGFTSVLGSPNGATLNLACFSLDAPGGVENYTVTLASPSGTSITLVNIFETSGNTESPCFADGQPGIGIGTPPWGGTFSPNSGAMSDFDGEDPNGNWELCVTDQFGGGLATLNDFDLSFSQEPCLEIIPIEVFDTVGITSIKNCDGTVELNATGGYAGACFTPANGAQDFTFSIMGTAISISDPSTAIFTLADVGGVAGTYTVEVNDNNQNVDPVASCLQTVDITICEPLELVDTIIVNPTDCSTLGELTIVATGGIASVGAGAIEYSIDAGATWTTNNAFTGLALGTYDVIIRNDDGTCELGPFPVTIDGPTEPIITDEFVFDETDCGLNDGQIVLGAIGDAGSVIEFSIDGGTTWTTSNSFTGLAPGTYDIVIRYEDGTCVVIGSSVTINPVVCCEAAISYTINDEACNNEELELCFVVDDEANALGSPISIIGDNGININTTITTYSPANTVCFVIPTLDNQSCDIQTVNLDIEVVCAADLSPIIVETASISVYPDAFAAIVTAADCTNAGSVEVISVDGAICDSVVGMDDPDSECPNDFVLSYDNVFFAGTDCEQAIMIDTSIAFTESPIFVEELPADISLTCADEIPDADVLTATDACNNVITVDFDEVDDLAECPDTRTITRTWTANNNCGEEILHTQVIEILPDTEAPVIMGTSSNEMLACGDVPPILEPTLATDNCDDNIVVNPNFEVLGNKCSGITTTYTYGPVEDACGNVSEVVTYTFTTEPCDCDCPTFIPVSGEQTACLALTPDLSDATTGFAILTNPDSAGDLIWTTDGMEPAFDTDNIYDGSDIINSGCDVLTVSLYAYLECDSNLDTNVDLYIFAGSVDFLVVTDPAKYILDITPSTGCGQAPVIVDSECPTLVSEGWNPEPVSGCNTADGVYEWVQSIPDIGDITGEFCTYVNQSGSDIVPGCEDCLDGCTDPCAPNYDATATTDDGSCEDYDTTCTIDCEAGIVEEWDSATCECVTIDNPILGCTDPLANNYNPNAQCDDGFCDYGCICTTIYDPVCGLDGITYSNPCYAFCAGVEWTPGACGGSVGCTDPCAPNYDPIATTDDGSCEDYDTTCTVDCENGIVEEWDSAICGCVTVDNPISGCTDPVADNYDVNAQCDDGSCTGSNVGGCLDPCAPNYNELAGTDDGSCESYDTTCNTDCTLGDLEIWDAGTCSCVVETLVVEGCTDDTACNYDPNANCDDNSCATNCDTPGCTDPCASNYDSTATVDDDSCMDYDTTCTVDCENGIVEEWDSAICGCVTVDNFVSGCTDPLADNYDVNAQCDDGSCTGSNVGGCLDPCAPNYNSLAGFDDGSCESYDMTCNTDCSMGDLEIWDAGTCSCVVEMLVVEGCTDDTACNYDPNANCDDNSCATNCDTPGCTDPCASNYDSTATVDDDSCMDYDTTCTVDCENGIIEEWDAATCGCITVDNPVSGCTDPVADNYDVNAQCDDGSCTGSNVGGCLDPCAPNYNELAGIDDGSCEFYDTTCNTDCSMGDLEMWDAGTCGCVVEMLVVEGCTDDTACNYDPNANCDDNSCATNCDTPGCTDPCASNYDSTATVDDDSCMDYDTTCTVDCENGIVEEWDSAICGCVIVDNFVSGCTDPLADNYDVNAQCDDGSCTGLNVGGCLDPCAANYNELAGTDDGSCEAYDTTCNTDCTLGDLETWDAATCSCVVETLVVEGCTDDTACNYDPNANCDDNSCATNCDTPGCTDPCAPNYDSTATVDDDSCLDYDTTCTVDCENGIVEEWDSGTCGCVAVDNFVSGCTDPLADNYDINAQCDDGSCTGSNVGGCLDPCAPNYNELAGTDDGSCESYDTTCNTDCTLGDLEIWDVATCSCVVETLVVEGCTDDTACNYDPNANCDDNSCATNCDTPGCTDPCASNYDSTATVDDDSCLDYDTTCTVDCENGIVEEWDSATCGCVTVDNFVLGCTDPLADNYDVNAQCDDGSCTGLNVGGCLDPCAANYNELAGTDDGSCEAYDTICNTDCTLGDLEIWDAATCGCVVETLVVEGCIDDTACNYDPNANCDDNSCATNCDIPGCTNPCASNYDATATVDDDSCMDYDTTCTIDCENGIIEEWDSATCGCVTVDNFVSGCTDPLADNYDVNAQCDDGSCTGLNVGGCLDPCAPNYNSLVGFDDGSCEDYSTTCDDGCDSTMDIYDTNTCSCVYTSMSSCDDQDDCTTDTYNSTTCECEYVYTCGNAAIAGTVFFDNNNDNSDDSGDGDVSGIIVTLYDAFTDMPVATVTTDADGNYQFDDVADGTYYINFEIPAGNNLVTPDVGSDETDSDADDATGNTPVFGVGSGDFITDIDAGINDVDMSMCDDFFATATTLCDKGVEYEVIVSVLGGDIGTNGYIITNNQTGESFTEATVGIYTYGPFDAGTSYSFTVSVSDSPQCSATFTSSAIDCTTTAVELIQFDGKVMQNGNLLSWITGSEQRSDYFRLMRSEDGIKFEEVNRQTGAGNSNELISYSYLDKDAPDGYSYYQLDQVDYDGNTQKSRVVTLYRSTHIFEIVDIYPNPTTDLLNLEFNSPSAGSPLVKVYDAKGAVISKYDVESKEGINQLQINAQAFTAGIYFIEIIIEDAVVRAKFIKD